MSGINKWSIGCRCCGGGPCADGQICITSKNACSPFGLLPGATVTIKRSSDGSVIGSCVTDAITAQCCVTVPGSDTYDIIVSKSSCSTTKLLAQPVGCGATVNLDAGLYCGGSACVVFDAASCLVSTPLPGVTITISGPDSGVVVTGSDGKATWCTGTPGTYSYTASMPPRWTDKTGSFTITSSLCGGGSQLIHI